MDQADNVIEAIPTNSDELIWLQTNLSTKLTALEALKRDSGAHPE